MKLLTIAVPCFNSQDYMAHCIDSLLVGGEELEIIIVDDGSTDETGAIADRYAQKYPAIVRVIHQENGGHGAGIMVGYQSAGGRYYKVVDSDDWLEEEAFRAVLAVLRAHASDEDELDVVISNYVYDKVGANHKKVMSYESAFPRDRVFGWSEMGVFKAGQVIMMHSLIYRTQLLKDIRLELPKHVFYEDSLFAAIPLLHAKRLYYISVDMYRYFIGRADQSVNEGVLAKRIDQHASITKMLVDAYLEAEIREPKLARYLRHNIKIVLLTSSVGFVLAGGAHSRRKRRDMWRYVRRRSPELYLRIRFTVHGMAANLPGSAGDMICRKGFRVIQKNYGFN